MAGDSESSFYLYGVGEKPEALTLGSLVLEKYWQPLIARHYTHGMLSPEDLQSHAYVSHLNDVTLHGKSHHAPSVSISGVNIVDLKLTREKNIERMVTAKKGVRMILKDPEAFLTNSVLTNSTAQQKLKLWLSASRSDYIMRAKFARRPKIWLLTGLYMLEGTRSMSSRSQSVEVSTEVSGALVGALSSVPVGGSIGVGNGKEWQVGSESVEQHVWAVQYHLLDAHFIKLGKEGLEGLSQPLSMGLHRDILSINTLRGGGRDGVELELKSLKAAREKPNEFEVDGHESDSTEEYEKRLEEAIAIFEKAPKHFLS
ncbi:uncharacterized protein ACLA_004170 [Aspergillus clavatus NRRL 1]|uniref:Uncharacterized protein n=1 Tax=Aspergillus clavatus (strain ATCC 1007 / CBS 513.65 / DSM 816 / NCTC 3887 / NRRL 1 / QM 1276 / 107) TaxID=344612 RepID=A1C5N5_ASPCL|nr:uncharacterized protein ACLA_004170 [Aspergillus clavatus NRRL 1]EAW15003.1 conserved hypothetical protein [Aspergillus clavatus NRRL 1]